MIVVAGVGNVLLGDDGFGPAVVTRLGDEDLGPDTRVVDAGIRGVHTAFDLADGVDLLIAVDLVAGAGPPGEVVVLEPRLDDLPASVVGGHGIDLGEMVALARRIGTGPAEVLVVGCAPLSVDEGIGLSPPVDAAVETAASVVAELVRRGSGRSSPCSDAC